MSDSLLKHVATLSNEDLVDILVSEEDYISEALNWARFELEKRQIPRSDLDLLFEDRRRIKAENRHRAEAKLSLHEKLLCIIFPPVYIVMMHISPLLALILPRGKGMIAYREAGYKTKAAQAVIYGFIGIIMWILFFILVFTF